MSSDTERLMLARLLGLIDPEPPEPTPGRCQRCGREGELFRVERYEFCSVHVASAAMGYQEWWLRKRCEVEMFHGVEAACEWAAEHSARNG